MVKFCILGLIGTSLIAQTSVNLSKQSHNSDFSNFAITKPITIGTTNPSTCAIGQLFYNSTAAQGQNVLECGSGNSWTVVGSGTITIGASNGPLSALPNPCVVGSFYIANDQPIHEQIYDCPSINNPTQVNPFAHFHNIMDWGCKGDGSTDDTTCINNFTTYMDGKPGDTAYIPSGKYIMHGTIRSNSNINWMGNGHAQSFFVEADATPALFIWSGNNSSVSGWNPGPRITNLGFAGLGASTTGDLLVVKTGGNAYLDNVSFIGTAGIGLLIASERVYMTNMHWQAVKRAIATDPGLAINEVYLDHFNILSPGTAESDVISNGMGSSCYSINSVSNVFPSSGILVSDQHATIDFNANVDELKISDGSIKPLLCGAGIRIRAAYSSNISSLYEEGFYNGSVNPSVIYGGNHVKTTLTNGILTSSLNFDVTDGQWFSYYSDPQDLQTAQAIYVLRPPDYSDGSTNPSSLGGGITQGSYEYIKYKGMIHDATGSNWHVYVPNSGRAQFGTTALAWPGGAILEEAWGTNADAGNGTIRYPNALKLSDNHFNSVNSANQTNYTSTCDNTNEKVCGEIVAGFEPDNFFIPGSSQIFNNSYGFKFDGNNRFGCGWSFAGNIDLFTNSLIDMNTVTGAGSIADNGGIPSTSGSLSGAVTGACTITRETWGSVGTTLRYIDHGTSIFASGASSGVWFGWTRNQDGILTISNNSTPVAPNTGYISIYAKGSLICHENSSGSEVCN